MYIIPEYSSSSANETYHGLILTLQDALLILEATRQKILPIIKRRLNDIERKTITLGSVFAWSETKCGMKRWTDGKIWLASKIKGPFLIYCEQDEARNNLEDGLVKQSFSLTTKQNEKFNLICYYRAKERADGIIQGQIPSEDPVLRNLQFDTNVYLSGILQFKPTGFAQTAGHQPPQMPQYARNVRYDYAPPPPYVKPQQAYELPLLHNYYNPQHLLPTRYVQAPGVPGLQAYQVQPPLPQQLLLQMHILQQPQPPYAQHNQSVYVPRRISAPHGEHIPAAGWGAPPSTEIMSYNSGYPATMMPVPTMPYPSGQNLTTYSHMQKQPSPNFTYSATPVISHTSHTSLLPLAASQQLPSISKETAQKTTLPSILPQIALCTTLPLPAAQSKVDKHPLIK